LAGRSAVQLQRTGRDAWRKASKLNAQSIDWKTDRKWPTKAQAHASGDVDHDGDSH